MIATNSIKNNAGSKGKQPIRNQQRAETKKPKNSVFSMHGQDILEDDPTYAGGTHATPVRAVARPNPSRARDLGSTTVPEGEETREGMSAFSCSKRQFCESVVKKSNSLTRLLMTHRTFGKSSSGSLGRRPGCLGQEGHGFQHFRIGVLAQVPWCWRWK